MKINNVNAQMSLGGAVFMTIFSIAITAPLIFAYVNKYTNCPHKKRHLYKDV